MLAPAGTPDTIVAQLQADTAKVLKIPQLRERLAAQGLDVYGSSSTEFTHYLGNEISKWDKVIRTAQIHAE